MGWGQTHRQLLIGALSFKVKVSHMSGWRLCLDWSGRRCTEIKRAVLLGGLAIKWLYDVEVPLSTPALLRVFIISVCSILFNAFSVSLVMIMIFFLCLVNLVHHMTALQIHPLLHFWDESHLLMAHHLSALLDTNGQHQFLLQQSPLSDTQGAAAAAAKLLQSCPTLCDPIDSSTRGSIVPGILQARTLEWVAISFSNAWKWTVKMKSLSRVRLFATPWTVAYQAPLSMGFSRQEYWSGVPLPSPDTQGDFILFLGA